MTSKYIVCTLFLLLLERNIENNFDFSARSRVRGTLEIYHAFVRDLDATSSSGASDSDWDVIDHESNASVCILL